MTIKSWLKKTGMAISLATALTGCDMLSPEGVAVKQNADGVLTQEEAAEAESALGVNGKVKDFVPFLNFVNEADVFRVNELEKQGLPGHRFSDDLHVYMVKDEAEMKEKYEFGNRPWVPPAFHGDTNSTLYIISDYYMPPEFMLSFLHEAGHDIRNDAYEFPSEANRNYFAFRAYAMNRRIGSVFADYAFRNPMPKMKGEDVGKYCQPVDEYLSGDFHRYYGYADLEFLIQANLANGNLEKAFDKIMRSPMLYLEASTKSVAENYPDMCSAMLGEFETLIEQPAFRQELLQHVSRDEADAYVAFLRLSAMDKIGYLLLDDGLITRQEWLSSLAERANKVIDMQTGNPFFHSRAISVLSFTHIMQAMDIIYNPPLAGTMQGIRQAHDIAKKVIDMNRQYPCEYKFYECIGNAAEIRDSHTLAYLYATYYAHELIASGVETPETLILIPNEYAAKFYSNGNYHYEDNNENAAVYAPQITLFGGKVEEALATIDATYGNMQDGITHLCNAANWYWRTLEAGCNRIPDAEKKAKCESMIDASFEQAARDKLNRSTLFYNTYCI